MHHVCGRSFSFFLDELPQHPARSGNLVAGLFLWRWKGGFYNDGRFATLKDVLDHYDRNFKLGLNDQEEGELIEYLKSL